MGPRPPYVLALAASALLGPVGCSSLAPLGERPYGPSASPSGAGAPAPPPGGPVPSAERPSAEVERLAPRGGPEPAVPRVPDRVSAGDLRRSAEDVRTFEVANRVRAEHGLSPFRHDARLQRAAYDHSREQYVHGYMGHGSPDPARDDLGDRVRAAGYVARRWAEVVAKGYDGPEAVVDGWMNSRGHRRILLDPDLEDAAFSRVGDCFTGNFGTRRTPSR